MALRGRWLLPLLLVLLAPRAGTAQQPAAPLPHYDLNVEIDVVGHAVYVRERVTWTNPGTHPTAQLVFNDHAHFKLPDRDVGITAKMFEILRMMPSEVLDLKGHATDVRRASRITAARPDAAAPVRPASAGLLEPPRILGEERAALPFGYRKDNDCALVITLPEPVAPGASVTVELELVLRLPQVQGRWGQWQGVTFLSNWLPVLAVYDDAGWQPTPYIPWHQPFFNEAGLYTVRLTLPADHKVACTAAAQAEADAGGGRRRIDFAPCLARDFAIVASARFREYTAQAGDVRVACLAFPEHEHYARFMLQSACASLTAYAGWFGPYPYRQFTIVESFFGWNSNECAGLVMIDERIFDMPHAATAFVDYLVAHETAHQWWYNVVGTNGYAETFMDEGPATYFAYRLMRKKYGKNDALIHYPGLLQWMPNVRRDDFRVFNLYGTLGRGEAGPTVQDIPKYDHLVNLYSMSYERGGKVIGMIEDRLGEERFLDFTRGLCARYRFRILRVADFQRELETCTGNSWDQFFRDWIYGAGLTDWSIESVTIRDTGPAPPPAGDWLSQLANRAPAPAGPCEVTVVVRQKADVDEGTVLGFCFNGDGSDGYQVRIPIIPQAAVLDLPEVPGRVEAMANHRMRVVVTLPRRPTQVTVDPDQLLVDRNPANNFWKPPVRFRLTPLYTFLDETDLTNAFDRWNVTAGPWLFAPTYDNPFFTRATRFGLRAGTYRTAQFEGGVYTAYRTDYRDFVAGVDAILEHWPWAHTEVGFVAERRLVGTLAGQDNANRGVVYARYVIDYGDSLYLPPFQYVEAFGTIQDDMLPYARQATPTAQRFQHQGVGGLHYHLNYLTPYWDAEGGFSTDFSYATGLEIPGESKGITGSQQAQAQLTYVWALPEGLGWFSDTRLAFHGFGAVGLPTNIQYFALGGGELFRGFDLAQRQGSALWVGNVEWRVPLLRHVNWGFCDRALEVRNVYGALFCDVGNVYLDNHSVGGVATAAGAGVRVDVSWFTFLERTILRLDAAKTVTGSTPIQFWVGIEHPF